MRMCWLVVLTVLTLQAEVIKHPNCQLHLINYRQLDLLSLFSGVNLLDELKKNNFQVISSSESEVSVLRETLEENELLGVVNLRVKNNGVSFWDELAGKKKRYTWAGVSFRIEKQTEDLQFVKLYEAVETRSGLDEAEIIDALISPYLAMIERLPNCQLQEPEPTPTAIPTPEIIPTVEPTPTAQPTAVVPEVSEGACVCYPGETSSTHLCHNKGIAENPQFYFINCKNGNPVYDTKKPGYWLLTNKVACSVYPACCDSRLYKNTVDETDMTIGRFCVQLAQTIGKE